MELKTWCVGGPLKELHLGRDTDSNGTEHLPRAQSKLVKGTTYRAHSLPDEEDGPAAEEGEGGPAMGEHRRPPSE